MLSARLSRAASIGALTLVPTVICVPAAHADAPPTYDAVVYDGGINDGIVNGNGFVLAPPSYQPAVALDTSTGTVTVTVTQLSNGAAMPERMVFAPPTGQTSLTVGTTYATSKAPTASTAGLDARNGSAQCTTSTGHLTVSRLDTDPATSTVTAFAATFDQTCTGRTGTLFGEVRLHAPEGYRAARVAPLTVSFGNVPVATTSAAQTVTLAALTGDPLATAPASLRGPNADEFVITTDDCASRAADSVTTGTTCTVSVRTSPTDPGVRTATLAIPDGTARGSRLVTLTATGTVPPSAPGSITATTEGDGVALQWTAPADNGGSAITKYSVYRGDTAVDLSWLADTSTLSYADTVSAMTQPGHDYVYAVAATNAAGTGPQTAAVSGRTPDAVVTSSSSPAVLTVDGSLGSYVAGGKSWAFVVSSGTGGDSVSVSGSPSSLSVNGHTADFTHFYTVTLAAPSGQRLVAGTTYSGTQQFADATHAGLDVTGDGSGCGTSSGQFTVQEAAFAANGSPLRVAIDYEVSCGTSASPPVDGVIRFGSDVGWTGVTVDVPTTPAPVGVATDEVEHVRNVGTTIVTLGAAHLHAGPPWDPDTSADWSLGNDGCNGVTLQPGDSCPVTLQVTPTASGPREVGLAISDDTPLGTHDRYLSVAGVVPPPAPGYINATAAAGGGIHLQWSIDEDPNARITRWDVLRGTSPDDLAVVGSVARSSVVPTWDDSDTTAGPRVYGVRAINVAGTGPFVTTALTYGPGAPQAATAVALAHSVGLTWEPPTAMDSATVTYRVLSGPAADALTDVTPTTATSLVLPGLAPGTTRYLSVEAVYDGAVEGPASPVVSATAADSQLVEADSDGVLRVHAMAGGPGIPITDGYAVHDTPTASPDGQVLAYTAGSSMYLPGHIVVRAADGSGAPTQLTNSTYHDDSPVFTPDGHRLYFVRWTNGTPNIHSVLTAGGGESTVPNSTQLLDPTITPDGKTLIATDWSSASAPLVRINLGDGSYTKTAIPGTAYGSSPAVSPDGRRLSFLNASGVVQVIPIAGGTPTTVQTPPGVINTSWSADGKWIYASAIGANGGSDLWQLHGDGQGWPTMITGNDLVDEGWVTTDTIDTAPPSVTVSSLPAVALGSQVRASWSGTDALSAVTSYDVRVDRVASDGTDLGWQNPVVATPNTSIAVPLPTDFETCVSVRGRDRAGNLSPWSPSRCTIRPMDDSWMIASTGVTRAKGTAYYSGTISRATTKGAVLSRGGIRGKRFDVVATTCPTCGAVEVRVGTHLVGTLSLHSATVRHKVVLALPLQSKTVTGTLRVRVTSSGKLVEIDGAGVGRQ